MEVKPAGMRRRPGIANRWHSQRESCGKWTAEHAMTLNEISRTILLRVAFGGQIRSCICVASAAGL